jgi:hypothetical protein
MALFRRKPSDGEAEGDSGRLADGAPRMRDALAAMVWERRRVGDGAEFDLRALTGDLLSGEVAAPTGDVARLVRRNTDPAEFYEKEIAPSWEGLAEAQRAARLEGFLDLARMLDEQGREAGLPEEMAATVHTKTLLLAFAFDETYGFIGRIASGRDAE